VGRELSRGFGVLEPWQSARTITGQVTELRHQIEDFASPPAVLVGHSWGAWLAVLLVSKHPEFVRRLVLVGSAPFRARDAASIDRRRWRRIPPAERRELTALWKEASDPRKTLSSRSMHRIMEIFERADSYELLPRRSTESRFEPRVFFPVWRQAERLRRSGALERSLRRIRVPVLVLHGRYDPHPVRGVVAPLRDAGVDVRVVLFDRCGHAPWWERYGRAPFFRELRKEMRRP
jgi:pimeloyl-ACP methyl ester carboxylesterase